MRLFTKRATGTSTAWVFQGKTASIETNTKNYLLRGNTNSPEQTSGFLDFSEIGVCVNIGADGIEPVPETMEVIGHEIDPVDIFGRV